MVHRRTRVCKAHRGKADKQVGNKNTAKYFVFEYAAPEMKGMNHYGEKLDLPLISLLQPSLLGPRGCSCYDLLAAQREKKRKEKVITCSVKWQSLQFPFVLPPSSHLSASGLLRLQRAGDKKERRVPCHP